MFCGSIWLLWWKKIVCFSLNISRLNYLTWGNFNFWKKIEIKNNSENRIFIKEENEKRDRERGRERNIIEKSYQRNRWKMKKRDKEKRYRKLNKELKFWAIKWEVSNSSSYNVFLLYKWAFLETQFSYFFLKRVFSFQLYSMIFRFLYAFLFISFYPISFSLFLSSSVSYAGLCIRPSQEYTTCILKGHCQSCLPRWTFWFSS